MRNLPAVRPQGGDIVILPSAKDQNPSGVISIFSFCLKIFSNKSSNQSSEPIFALSAELFSAADHACKNSGDK